jgi:hypothetical protein
MTCKYKEILDNIEFSFSTVHLYETCPYAFYNKKICGDKGISNAFAQIGKLGHLINEKIYKKESNIEEALNEWIEEFDYHVTEYISDNSKEKKYLAFCDYLATFDESFFDKYEILGVEVKFHWKIGKHKCIGFADLIVRDISTKEIILIDHKSAPPFFGKKGQLLKAQVDNFNAYSKQMYMYSKPIYEKYGEYPTKIIWNHMFENNTTEIEFNMEDYKMTLKWFKETVRKIYNDKEFNPCKSYMMCNQLCNYRLDCEYKNEEEG